MTFGTTNFSTVEYEMKRGRLDRRAEDYSTLFEDGGSEKRIPYIHTVTLKKT